MRMSNSFFMTRKEYPKDENTISAKLLIKSGMIFKNDNGIYSYLPIGLKVINNIKELIRKEMQKNNAEEVLMPSLVDTSYFENSGRNTIFGNEMFILNGRNNKEYALCPTHEELFAYLVRNKIQSYKDLHFTLFQMSNKYRDEIRTEYGLIRKKEFLMADAYSFDADMSGLDVSYDKMYQTFKNIFKRCNIDTMVVKSDPEAMKGTTSEEFQVECDFGDNVVVKCKKCTYSSNIEEASCVPKTSKDKSYDIKMIRKVHTPNIKTVKELKEFFNVDDDKILKSLIIKADSKYIMILLKGSDELNILKLEKVLKTKNIEIPSEYELEKIGTEVGFIGPIKSTMQIIADTEVKNMHNVICGANVKNYHYKNVNPRIDFKIDRYADIKLFNKNSLCPKCGSPCEMTRGIEVGHIFKLETNYSKIYNLRYLDETNQFNYVHMGSYGIGIDRLMSAIVEKNHDENGIIWPTIIAPYKVAIVVINVNDKESYKYSKMLYERLLQNGIDTILDDRKESVGTKFNDMDLIGIPIRITVGKKLSDDYVELKLRNESKSKDIKTGEVIKTIDKILKNNY